jgi:hypothetical protein
MTALGTLFRAMSISIRLAGVGSARLSTAIFSSITSVRALRKRLPGLSPIRSVDCQRRPLMSIVCYSMCRVVSSRLSSRPRMSNVDRRALQRRMSTAMIHHLASNQPSPRHRLKNLCTGYMSKDTPTTHSTDCSSAKSISLSMVLDPSNHNATTPIRLKPLPELSEIRSIDLHN